MPSFIKAAGIKEVPKSSMKTVRVNGKAIAICNIDGEYFAVDDTCTHQKCSLGTEGFLDNSGIICGCHGSLFDVKTGHVKSLPATVDLKTYKTKIEGEDILVEI